MEKTGTKIDLKEQLLWEYKQFESDMSEVSAATIHKVRREAKEYFTLLGFPGKANEEWRFTNVNPIIANNYKQTYQPYTAGHGRNITDKYLIPGLDADYIVLINGIYSEKHSIFSKKIPHKGENGVYTGGFMNAQTAMPGIIESHFGKYADFTKDGFTALNTAYTYDGSLIYLNKGTSARKPIVIVNIADSSDKDIIANIRNLIVLGDNSSADVTEIYYSRGNGKSFTNTVSEIVLGNNSELHYNKIQIEGDNTYHVGTTQFHQGKDSRLFSTTISSGGTITRNNLNSFIGAEGVDCYFRGLYIVKDNQIIDNHTLADHASPNSRSNEHYKGILDGRGTGVFNGKIMVRQDAQKTNAYQTNNNILLTNEAVINSKPQLEIFADDVKCSHGATTGQLNPDELFYLRSRGIGEEDAKGILLFAFCNEIIEEIKNEPLREMLVKMIKC
jgi:Fe-S cluster assembly protein SufD